MPIEATDTDLLWKQYALQVDLYKFYLDLAVKVNVFYYAITGSILACYFKGTTDSVTRHGLLLPIAFSIGLGTLFSYGASQLLVVREEVFSIRDDLGLETAPEMMVLIVFLKVIGLVLLLSGLALTWFYVGAASWLASQPAA